MVKRWIGLAAIAFSCARGAVAVLLGGLLTGLACFRWGVAGQSWWAVALGVAAAAVVLAAARQCRQQVQRERDERAIDAAVEREIKGSLTDEALAWAVLHWRRRLL